MRVISFNTQGIKQAVENGFFDWLREQDADVICLQDLRATEAELTDSVFHLEGYQSYFFDALAEGYSGVVVYTKHQPKALIEGLGFELCDNYGRFLQIDFDKVSIASIMIPKGLLGSEAQADKDIYLQHFRAHLEKSLRKRRNFIFAGTYNIAHTPLDLSRVYQKKTTSGFYPHECDWFDGIFDELGYIDAQRVYNPRLSCYTWWPNYNRARLLDEGVRLDYQVASPGLEQHVEQVEVYRDALFSEHAPLIVDYDVKL